MKGSLISHYLISVTLLLLFTNLTNTQVQVYITPSLNDPCPIDPCLTLSRFAINSDYNGRNETDISLLLLPGSHPLDGVLSVANKDSFMMTEHSQGYGDVLIECDGPSGSFDIRDTKFALIQGIQFMRCSSNGVTQVDKLIINNTTFTGTGYRNTTAGALNIISSNVFVFGSQFVNSSVDYGGAINAQNSILHLEGTFAGYNKALFNGGVVASRNSSVNITKSTFIKNEAGTNGGVVYSENDFYTVTEVSFTGNFAGKSGGVMFTVDLTAGISYSSFSNNTAASFGGTIMSRDSLVNIAFSRFTKNEVINNDGGVAYSIHDMYTVTDVEFTDNNARYGGVMWAAELSATISKCSFSKNTASLGGTMCLVNNSATSIKTSTFRDNKAESSGGVVWLSGSFIEVSTSKFVNNIADSRGVLDIGGRSTTIIDSSVFINNSASYDSGVLGGTEASITIRNSTFYHNRAGTVGGAMVTTNCFVHAINSTFDNSLGSFYVFNSRLLFSGHTTIQNSAQVIENLMTNSIIHSIFLRQEGGAVISVQSTITFTGVSKLLTITLEMVVPY